MKIRAALYIAILTIFISLAGCVSVMPVSDEKAGPPVTAKPSPAECVYAVYKADSVGMGQDEFSAKLKTTMGVILSRLNGKGYSGAKVVQEDSGSIRAEVPLSETSDAGDPNTIFSFIGNTGLLEFKNAAGETKLTGADVLQAYESYEENEWAVALKFNDEGAKLFGDLTADAYNNGTDITVTLDGETISTASVDDGPIYGGSAVIEGGGTSGFTKDSASDLAIQIQSGALPLKLKMTDCGTGVTSGS